MKLYHNNINQIKIPAGGVTVWGQKTLNMTTVNIKSPTKEEDCLEECNKCNGTGKLNNEFPSEPGMFDIKSVKCRFCNGTGKVEWLDKIYNRPKKKGISAKWTIDSAQDFKTLYGEDLQDELIETMSEHIAKEIDKEILSSLGVNNE